MIDREPKNTVLCAAFCGVGKSYLCSKFPEFYKEIECWEYQIEENGNFPKNYVRDILKEFGKVKYLFIATDPRGLSELHKLGIRIRLIYPQNELKKEYFRRYIARDSHPDFLNAIDRYWDMWIDELKEQNYCNHTMLRSGEYLQDVL